MSVSFLSQAEQYFIIFIYHILLIHTSINEHLGCFYKLAIVNNAAMNINVQIFHQDSTVDSLKYLPRGGTARPAIW